MAQGPTISTWRVVPIVESEIIGRKSNFFATAIATGLVSIGRYSMGTTEGLGAGLLNETERNMARRYGYVQLSGVFKTRAFKVFGTHNTDALEHRYFSVGAPEMTPVQDGSQLDPADLSARRHVANLRDIPLLSEDDLETSLDTVCEAAAGPIEGVFGPASLTWRVDREAAVFLGAGRALLLRYLPRLNR
jgi:hypothetical protein